MFSIFALCFYDAYHHRLRYSRYIEIRNLFDCALEQNESTAYYEAYGLKRIKKL